VYLFAYEAKASFADVSFNYGRWVNRRTI